MTEQVGAGTAPLLVPAEHKFQQAIAELRTGNDASGLGMLRAVPWCVSTRKELIRYTYLCADVDTGFRQLVGLGDRARDDKRFGDAEYNYGEALGIYPFHGGYMVQYAHALKEQGRYEQSELWYRSAFAAGAPMGDVKQHLDAVVAAQGLGGKIKWVHRSGERDFDASDLPTAFDISTIGRLLLQSPPGLETSLKLIRECSSCEDVAVALAEQPQFATRNRTFLRIVKAKGALA